MQRLGSCLLAVCASIVASAQPAFAQQTLNFSLGYFTVRGEDARVEGDVLVENLNAARVRHQRLQLRHGRAGNGWCRSATISRLAPASRSRGAPCRAFTPSSSIATAPRSSRSCGCAWCRCRSRFACCRSGSRRACSRTSAPGSASSAGATARSGEFVDFGRVGIIFRDQFVASGSETGPVALGGIRFAGDTVSGGFEVRYQSADAALGSEFAHLGADPRIDLGGWTYQMTIGYRFGR